MGAPRSDRGAASTATRRLRVAEVAWSGGHGGAERSLLDFAACLDRDRFDCRFVFLAGELWLGPELRRLGFDTIDLGWTSPRSIRGRASLVRCLAHLKPDVIHDHVLPTFTRSLFAMFFPRVARISTDHGAAPLLAASGARLRTALYGWDFRHAHRIVVHSRAMASMANRLYRPAPGQLAHVPLGTALAGEPLPARSADGTFRIGFLGRLTNAHKGLDVLLRAIALMNAGGGRPVRLLVAGEGPDRANNEALAAALGLTSCVEFQGWIEDRRAFFEKIDVLAVPSRREPFGLVALEAMAFGRPVVAAAVGGLEEIAETIPFVRLVPPEAPRELADGLWAASGAVEEATREVVSKLVVDRFGARAMTRGLEDLYVETAAR